MTDEQAESAEGVVRVSRSLSIPLGEIEVRATTSGGPGGQHANRTLSRIEVRFDIAASPSLGPRQRERLLERLGRVARASSSDERSQLRNRQIAIERLSAKLADALRVDAPRFPTRPTKASKVRRLDDKRRQSVRKSERRKPLAD